LWLPWVKKYKEVSPRLEKELLTISPRQIDRRLGPYKKQVKKRLYGRTKPGTLLKHQIPIKAERWETSEPGFGEIDLVSHFGDRADGEFIHTLTFTDIHSTWTETRAVMGKSQVFVQEALDDIRNKLPFPMRGIDSDNGSEFINHHLMAYCTANQIEFTRSRPYNKDDNAHVEQKNWMWPRQLLGYGRLAEPQLIEPINGLYKEIWGPLQNFFLPSMKLQRKWREGSRWVRRHDRPQTAYQRLLATAQLPSKQRRRLRDGYESLDPFLLAAALERRLKPILKLAA